MLLISCAPTRAKLRDADSKPNMQSFLAFTMLLKPSPASRLMPAACSLQCYTLFATTPSFLRQSPVWAQLCAATTPAMAGYISRI